MADYPIGATREEVVEIGNNQAITFLGPETRVLSTPQMILYMERTCRNLVLPMMDPGYDTVGTHVNVSHASAAPMGSSVTFSSELISVQDRKIEFRVQARLGEKTVGEGTHQRTVIDVARFSEKIKGNN